MEHGIKSVDMCVVANSTIQLTTKSVAIVCILHLISGNANWCQLKPHIDEKIRPANIYKRLQCDLTGCAEDRCVTFTTSPYLVLFCQLCTLQNSLHAQQPVHACCITAHQQGTQHCSLHSILHILQWRRNRSGPSGFGRNTFYTAN